MESILNYLQFAVNIVGFLVSNYIELFSELVHILVSFGSGWLEAAIYLIAFVAPPLLLVYSIVMLARKRTLVSFTDPLEKGVLLAAQVASVFVLILIIAMVYEVFARYVLSSPTFWAFEVSYMLMGSSFMLSIAYCLQRDQHVRVDFLYAALSKRGKASIDMIGYILVLPMALWMVGGLIEYFQHAYLNGERSGESAWNPPIWPFRFIFILGFNLLILQMIVEVSKALKNIFARTAH